MSWSGKGDALLMADDFDFTIASLETPLTQDVLDLIDEVMGTGHDETWFRWKHRDNPAGPSLAWVGRDDMGLVGVRLFMRWALRRGDRRLTAYRPVDTVTAPRARRRGVFSALARTALGALPDDAVVFNTPNANSRDGYRRLGWDLMDPVAHVVSVVPPLGGRAALHTGRDVLRAFDHGVEVDDGRIRTDRSSHYARWRYDDRSGRNYSFASLEQADEPTAVVYRIVDTRPRLLVVSDLAGPASARGALVRAMAREEGARLVLTTGGAGSEAGAPPSLSMRRGSSVVAVNPMASREPDLTSIGSWALTLGDLEDVI